MVSGRVPQRQLIAADSGGTVHTVQTDDQGRLLSNIIGGEIVARLGTLSVVKGGTIDVAETVQTVDELRSGTIAAVKSRGGTIGTGAASPGVAHGTIDVVGFSRFTSELKTGGTVVTVSHQFKSAPGAMWVEDGTDSVDGTGVVTTFDHVGYRFREVPQDNASTLDVTFRGRA